MRTKNAKAITRAEKEYLARVKQLPCGVCGEPGPSDAHHIEQGLHFLCIPLCRDCHQGGVNGFHGQRAIWNVYKMNEHTVLNQTIAALSGSEGAF